MHNFTKSFIRNPFIEKWYWSYFLQGVIVLGTLPVLIPIFIEKRADDAIAGMVVAAFYAGQMTSPIWGKAANRTKNIKFFFLLGLGMLGISAVFFDFINNTIYWIALSFLQGTGIGAANTVTAMSIIEFTPNDEWNKRIGWLQTFYGAGQAGGLALASALSFTPAAGIIISGLFMLPALFFGKNIRSEDKKFDYSAFLSKCLIHRKNQITHHFFIFSNFHMPSTSNIKEFFTKWENRFGIFISVWFSCNLSRSLILSLFPLLMLKVFSITPWISSLCYAVGSTLSIFMYYLSGILSSRIKNYRVYMIGLYMSSGGGLLLALLSFYDKTATSYLALAAFLLLVMGWPPLIVAGTAIIAKTSPFDSGSSIGIFNSAKAIGIVLGALIAGFLGLNLGYRSVLITSSLIGIAAILIASLTIRKIAFQDNIDINHDNSSSNGSDHSEPI